MSCMQVSFILCPVFKLKYYVLFMDRFLRGLELYISIRVEWELYISIRVEHRVYQ